MSGVFTRKKGAFASNLRPPKTQLLVVAMGALKSPPVTGSRGRRRRQVGWAPVWPAQSVRNMSTKQGVSWREQPVVAKRSALSTRTRHTPGHYHPPSRCGAHESKHSAIPCPWLPTFSTAHPSPPGAPEGTQRPRFREVSAGP